MSIIAMDATTTAQPCKHIQDIVRQELFDRAEDPCFSAPNLSRINPISYLTINQTLFREVIEAIEFTVFILQASKFFITEVMAMIRNQVSAIDAPRKCTNLPCSCDCGHVRRGSSHSWSHHVVHVRQRITCKLIVPIFALHSSMCTS